MNRDIDSPIATPLARLLTVIGGRARTPTDPELGNGVYGPAVNFSTAGAPGPFTVAAGSSKRVAGLLAELDTSLDGAGFGQPYRIDMDIIASDPGATIEIDWCDVTPPYSAPATPGHVGYESGGKYGGYNSTFRFIDIKAVGGAITVDNILLRKIITPGTA